MKAKLIGAVSAELRGRRPTHAKLAERSGLGRSTVTGILSGSLQKISLARALGLLEAAGPKADVKIHRAA